MNALANELVIRGQRIAQDDDGYFCLNDMWRLSKEKETKGPSQWRKLPTTRELAEAFHQTRGKSTSLDGAEEKPAIYAKMGKGGGTFAHIILALAYAEYLHPTLGIEVRKIALRVWAGDVSVFDDFTKQRSERAQEDSERVMSRQEIKRYNYDLNALLQLAGAKTRAHYGKFHNVGYHAQYDGLDENGIRKKKGLEKNQKILDHMSSAELIANMFRVSQTQQRLTYHPARTLEEAYEAHKTMGERVRAFIAVTGGPMPEDMPNVDSIAEARKRLKNLHKSRAKLK